MLFSKEMFNEHTINKQWVTDVLANQKIVIKRYLTRLQKDFKSN